MPILAALVALAAALLLTPVLRAAAHRFGLLDRPNERSSHTQPTPRSGGLAIAVALAFALLQAPQLWWQRPAAWALLAGGVLLALVGFCDDRFGLSPLVRLGVHCVAAAGLTFAAGPLDRLPLPDPLGLRLGSLGPLVSVLWIVAVVNFYNFMDGIDGLAAVQALVTGSGIAAAGLDPLSTFLGAALAGASAGFLVFNWSPASVFLGDAGSGLLGYTLAALPFLAPQESKATGVLFVACSLGLFLADATWTLVRRVARGERPYQAHREHQYQRLVIAGASHARVTAALGAGAAVLTLGSWIALGNGETGLWWAVLLFATALFGLEVWAVRCRESSRLPRPIEPLRPGPRGA